MTFARVASIKTTVGATGASQLIPPAVGVMTGDLMLAFCINRVTTTAITASAGWTSVTLDSNAAYKNIFARIADGSTNDRLTIAQTSDDWCVCMMRIIDHGVATIASDIKVGTWAGATSTTPDPPSLDAGSTDDWLWLCMVGGQLTASTNTLTGQPTNYTQAAATKSAASTTSVSLGVAYRALNAQTENPGNQFSQNTSRAWRGQTIAVKPGTARTGARIDVSPLAVFSNTVAVTSASFTPPANSVLVATCAVGNSTGSGSQTLTLTDSLSSSWTRLDTYQTAAEGLVEIHALDIGASPSARTVTCTGSGTNGKGVSLGLYCLLGTEPVATILGNTLHSAASSDNGSITVGTANSLVLVADLDNTTAALPGMRANTEIDLTTSDGTNGQKAAIGHVHDHQATGALTVGFTFTATAQNTLAAWELKELSAAVTGTVARTLDATTAVITGAVVNAYTGTVARTLDSATCVAAGTNTVPAITGTVARTLDSTTCVASGSRTVPAFTGTVARTLDATTCVASGSRTVPDFTGTVARTLNATTAVAAGTTTPPTIFGNPDQQGTSAGGLIGTLVATKYTLSEAALVRGLHYYAREDGNVKGAIYADSAGTPGTLIVANNTGTAVLRLQWNTVDVADTILAAGDYWIGFLEDEDSMRAFKAGGTNQAAYKTAQGYAGGMPSSWTPTAYQNNDYVAFADYTPAIVGTVARTLAATTCVATGIVTHRQTSITATQTTNDDWLGVLDARVFDGVVPEYEMQWGQIEPSQGSFSWTATDTIVDFAVAQGLGIEGHCLVWEAPGYPALMPTWVTSGSWTRTTLLAVLENHITQIVNRYKDRIHAWRVVNEAFNSDGTRRSWIMQTIIGDDWIEQAFQFAHAADPTATLIYNEYGIEWGSYGGNAKYDAVLAMVIDFKSRAIPIHGIGLQCHFDLQYVDFPHPSDFPGVVKAFESRGLIVEASELDIRTDNTADSQAVEEAAQAAIADIVCGAIGPVCVWSISDATSWLGPSAMAAPYSTTYIAKPWAYAADIGVITGTVARTLDDTTAVASGTRTVPAVTGTVARTLDSATASAAGTNTVPPITGTIARTLDATTCVASGVAAGAGAVAGAVARTLDSTTCVAAGARTVPDFTGTLARTLDPTTCVAVGTTTVPPITGTVTRTLDAVACVAVGLAAGQLPPLVPPFVAIMVGYETFTADLTHTTTVVTITTTSTVSSTARTSTVNQTLVGVT